MSKLTDRENNRARQAVSQMFSTASPAEDVVKEEVPEEVKEETLVAFEALETVAEVSEPQVVEPVAPKKKGRPVVNRETKKRYTITLFPSIYNKASEVASQRGKSLSEVVGDFLAEYIKED